MEAKIDLMIFLSFLISVLVCALVINEIKEDFNKPHEHVRTKQFITKYGTAPVVFCKTEYKIIANGTHSDIVLPVILFPEMEEVE